LNTPTPKAFGVYVNRYNRGEKYWFANVSIPHELLPLPPDVTVVDLAEVLTAALLAERDRRYGMRR
jgi:hypothetical protein